MTDDPNFRVGLPSIAFQVEYRGPQPAIRHDAETFVKGESKGGMKGVRMMSLPCQIDMAFALGEDKDSKGVVIAAESEKQATRSGSGVLTTRHGGTSSQPQTVSTRGRQCRIYQPAWPLDIRDGEEAVVWGVFVGEPEGVDEKTPPLLRAQKAEAAWLFKVSTSDKPKDSAKED